MIRNYLYLAALALAGFSCTTEDEKPTDVRKPGIDLTSLEKRDTLFVSGDILPIKATVNDNDKLKEIHVTVLNEADNSGLMHFMKPTIYSHDYIDTTYVLNTAEQATLKLRIEAIDLSGNTQFKEHRFHVAPR